MTLPQAIDKAVADWLDENGAVECRKKNGRGELVDLYLSLVPGKTSAQANLAISRHLGKQRGIIAPQYTKKNLKRKALGDPTSYSQEEVKKKNAISNPIRIYNPINAAKYNRINAAKYNRINAAKLKAKRAAAAVIFHNEKANRAALTAEEVEAVVDKIIKSKVIGDSQSTLQYLANDDSTFTFYVGLTKQHDITHEDLRWLTARGKNLPEGQTNHGGRNRPVLLWANGKNIKMKAAREELGFVSQVVFESAFLIDASRVEDEIQSRYQHLPLGQHRLWRCVAKGKASEKGDVTEKEVYKVFITYSMQVVEKLVQKIIKIQV